MSEQIRRPPSASPDVVRREKELCLTLMLMLMLLPLIKHLNVINARNLGLGTAAKLLRYCCCIKVDG